MEQNKTLDLVAARLEAGVEREGFLLEELKVINERLLCKFPSLALCLSLSFVAVAEFGHLCSHLQ